MSTEATKPEDRLLSMQRVAKMLGLRSAKTLTPKLQALHERDGNVLVYVNKRYYITESALRNVFPQIFSNTKSKVDDRFAALEQHVSLLESQVNETKKTLYAARVRIRQLESQLRPGKMPKED